MTAQTIKRDLLMGYAESELTKKAVAEKTGISSYTQKQAVTHPEKAKMATILTLYKVLGINERRKK